MKSTFLLCLLIIATTTSFAQRRMIPVTQSELTGISLPSGSMQDKRILSVTAANTLLNMESQKNDRAVSTTEVLVVPSASTSGFDESKLAKELSDQGWNISINPDDMKYAWLIKGSKSILMYFSSDPKEISLYFALADNSPQNPQVNNAPANKEISQDQQTIDSSVQYKPLPSQQSVNGFAFTTTNFDDGWVATAKDDWVQVTKGAIIVLIHYPNKQADAYNSVLMDGLKNAWNILVAPKYSSGSNFEFKPVSNWEPIEFAEADMVEKSSGSKVHVVLFKKNYSSGKGQYLEIITPVKTTFEQEFGAYHEEGSSGWERIEKMASYNKFAVSASDLSGKWTSDFSGAIQYVNAYTGFDAGMDTHASNENFQFGQGNSYQWDLGVASGAVGNIKFQSVKSSGNFSMAGNWQITFSDIEGKARTYNTHFSCIKGLRILWLDDRAFAKSL
jgi:hypothetical protein